MRYSTTQFLSRHIFMRNGFDNLWAGHKHIGTIFDHENEIG